MQGDLGEIVEAALGRAHRDRVGFHGIDPSRLADVVGQRPGEEPGTGIQVEQMLTGARLQELPHGGDECFWRPWMHLPERGRIQAPQALADDLLNADASRLRVGECDGRANRGRDSEDLMRA